MPKNNYKSKIIAATFVLLTLAVIGGIVTMIIFYNNQISTMNPTPRPTFPPTTAAPPPSMRLPRNLIPESYEIFLQPHLYSRIIEEVNVTSPNQTTLFTGNSTVHFKCVQRTRSIYLHSVDLVVSNSVVKNKDTDERIHSTVKYPKGSGEFLEVQLNEALEAGGNYSLFLAFKGEISESLYALYVSSYIEGVPDYEGDTNAQRFLAATNMEPTAARAVFPCFDEPEMKAVFHLTVIHRQGTTALGNAERSGSSFIDDEWQYTRFHPTPRMSTYLFAFTVSEFTATPCPHNRVDIKIFARPEATAAGHAQYAASITGKILDFYGDRFGIDYSQRKLDQIALPDLSPAAMENWGLVTYQEGVLLYEEGVTSTLAKERIASIIAHELAHQWFGNLVTMKWWNEIWLNEGFATYMTYIAVDAIEPSFKAKDTCVANNLLTAFEEDALASSHPLSPPEQDVQENYEIFQLFDGIVYSKGAVVLRMLADVLHEEVFNKGINMYLWHFRYNNTDEQNLWDYLQKAVDADGGHINVAKVMDPWTNQIGYPVITINTTNGEIYQKHFLFNDSSESSNWWYVPIRVMSKTTVPSLAWLDSSDKVKKGEFISKNGEWILANVDCTGYYRVNYNLKNWESLLTQLETDPERIPLLNRGQLIDDAFNLARAKLVDVTLALNLTRFLRNDTEYLPWRSAVRNLEYFVHMFDRSEVYGPMQARAYLRQQVSGLYNFFRNYTDNSTVPVDHSLQIHSNLRSTIYCQAVAHGGRREWEFAWKKYQTSVDTSEKDQLLLALSCTKEIWLLNRYLEYTLNPEKIRLMDTDTAIQYVAGNVAGQTLAWNFIRANWLYVSRGYAAAASREHSSEVVLSGLTDEWQT
ncbi:hypothetical protein F2P81_006785 [Scophthalmus maximus]|uniref:Aminopeptidase n=1 Tax=Scophthalmus maximus TaxID=52904 RepID=A0A6A4T401_SCOMX|nr:hypothetical protein F2P81_006785 [Scophthalmus maximus]